MSQRVQEPQKIDPKYLQNGVWGGSEVLGGGRPHFDTNLARSLASILRQNDPKGRQSDPEWSQMASKGRKISLKNRCENHLSFSYPFLYEELAERMSKYVENLSKFYAKTEVKQNW